MEDLALVEMKAYETAKSAFKNGGMNYTSENMERLVSILESFTDENYNQYVADKRRSGKEVTVEGAKAEDQGRLRFYREVIPSLKAKEEAEEKAKAEYVQQEREANRNEHPTFYIANGGSGDCFDYVGYDSNTHEIKTAFVDWDSGHGNEMLPDWENNDIKELPDSCIAAFKETAVKWITEKCGAYFFCCNYKGKMKVPCKVTTGRKFRGSGTLVRMTSRVWVERYGRKDISYTAHIIDEEGNEHTAVGGRLEFQPGTIEKVVKMAVDRMTVEEIQSVFYDMLWHFGKYRSDHYPKILAKAFEDLNKEDEK